MVSLLKEKYEVPGLKPQVKVSLKRGGVLSGPGARAAGALRLRARLLHGATPQLVLPERQGARRQRGHRAALGPAQPARASRACPSLAAPEYSE